MKKIVLKSFIWLLVLVGIFEVGLNWNLIIDKFRNKTMGEGVVMGNCTRVISDTKLFSEYLSNWQNISNDKKVGFIVERTGHSSGNTLFKVYVSPDGLASTSEQYTRLISNNDLTDDTQDKISSSTITTNGFYSYWMSGEDITGQIMASIDITTDGQTDVYICEQ